MNETIKAQIAQFPPFKAIRHDTIAAVMEQMGWVPNFESLDHAGRFDEVSPEQAILGIKTVGIWGFVDELTIHFWADDSISFTTLVFFLGHEIGHQMAKRDLQRNEVKETDEKWEAVQLEFAADGYGFTAFEAARLAREILGGSDG